MAVSVRNKRNRSRGSIDLPFFEDLFRKVWAAIIPVLGVTNTRSLFEHARAETALRYRVLERVRVMDDGVRIQALGSAITEGHEELSHLEEALWAYLEVFTGVLARLSGEMVSKRVVKVIERQGKGKEFSALLYRTGLQF